MKIALFFLIVGLSGCFANDESSDTTALQPNNDQMTDDDANRIAYGLMNCFSTHANSPAEDSCCGKNPFMETVQSHVKLLASIFKCPVSSICAAMATCLKDGNKSKCTIMYMSLLSGDGNLLTQGGLTRDDMMQCIHTCTKYMMDKHGKNLEDFIKEVLTKIAGTICNATAFVKLLVNLGVKGVSVVTANGAYKLLIDGKQYQCNGLMGFPDDLPDKVKDLLGPVSTEVAEQLDTLDQITGCIKTGDKDALKKLLLLLGIPIAFVLAIISSIYSALSLAIYGLTYTVLHLLAILGLLTG